MTEGARLAYMPVTMGASLEDIKATMAVIMVGDHWITTDDYLALETVEPEMITPLGRVNYGMAAVVGCHIETGSLVKSYMDGSDLELVILDDPEEEDT
jgi:hypothetical protein